LATWNAALFPDEDDYSEESGPDSIATCDGGRMSEHDAYLVRNDPFFHLPFQALEERNSDWEWERSNFWRDIRES
jgi:hypothetical protein